ncbi:unnamed protein product [Durusdinium trenchii]|uniref:Pentatricopeptide repeat-containing protein, chloroplastic n=2 Tax=Durusdinium trenchii TaxID=1381693 RepID=A0ABP0NKH5_9DINO
MCLCRSAGYIQKRRDLPLSESFAKSTESPLRARRMAGCAVSMLCSQIPEWSAVAWAKALRGQSWCSALGALNTLEKQWVQIDVVLCNTVISCYEKTENWPIAMDTFSSLHRTFSSPSAVSFGAVMSTCEKSDQWQWAIQMLSELYEADLQANAILMSSAMSACGGAHAWHTTVAVLRQFASSTTRSDIISFNSATSACEEVRRWKDALQIFLCAKWQQLQTTIVSYSAAMTACENQWLSAWQLFQLLRNDGILMSTIPFNAVASACAKAAEWVNALHLVNEVHQMLLQRTLVTYGSGISACEKSLQEWQRCLQLLGDLEGESLQGNLVVQNAVLSACEKATTATAWVRWPRVLHLLGRCVADAISVNCGVGACQTATEWRHALFLALPEGESQSVSATAISYATAAATGAATVTVATVRLLERLEQLGIQGTRRPRHSAR